MKTRASVCVLTFGLLACVSHIAAGSDGEFQSEASYGFSKFDLGDGVDGKTQALIFTRYFLPVDTDEHPLVEAAFLERASSMTLYLADGEIAVDSQSVGMETVALEVNLAQASSPYTVGLILSMGSGDVENSDATLREGFAALGLGWYVMRNLRVGATLASMDSLVAANRESVNDYAHSYGFNGKWVQSVGATNAIGVEAEYVRERLEGDSGKSKGYAVDAIARYYLTRSVGAGVVLEKTSNNEAGDTQTFGATLRAFFNDQLSVELEFAKTTGEDDAEAKEVSAIIGARF
jgi:hypothetical protein